MRRIHLLAILLLMTITLSASPVARKKALQKAQTFALKYRSAATASLKMAYSTDPAEGESGVYVFNIGQNEGFVVVSDDEADDVLGYSDTGSFDAQRMPENLRAWLHSAPALPADLFRRGDHVLLAADLHAGKHFSLRDVGGDDFRQGKQL